MFKPIPSLWFELKAALVNIIEISNIKSMHSHEVLSGRTVP